MLSWFAHQFGYDQLYAVNPNLGLHFSGNLYGTRAWYFNVVGGTEATLNLPQKAPNTYVGLGFCAWYVIADLIPGYNINNICIRRINAMFHANKGFKNTRFKRMDEFLQTELEIGQTEAAGYGEKPAEESHQRRSLGEAAKHARSQSTEAGSSPKKLRQKPVAEASSKGTSTLEVDPEPIHAGSKEDEYSEILLCLNSRQTNGPVVVKVEDLSEKVTERQTTGDESVPTLVPAKIVPSGSLQSQSVDLKDNQMMSSAGVPEQSPTIGLVGAMLPAVGVSPTLVSSPSSSEKLEYSTDDIDWDNVHPAPDTGKLSHLTEEEMQVAISEKELPLEGTAITKGILSALLFIFLVTL